jgi:hypothetical protein
MAAGVDGDAPCIAREHACEQSEGSRASPRATVGLVDVRGRGDR